MTTSKKLLGQSVVLSTLIATTNTLAAQGADREHLQEHVFEQMRWRELGPVTSGGRIVDVAVHPERPQIFWAASGSGGVWKTTNGGVTWRAQFQNEYTTSIGDIAVAPTNPEVLFLGTGEANNQRSSYWGNGVYRSRDGGDSWEHVGLDGTDHIGRIAIHPYNADIVFVAALGALYSSNEDRGLYRTMDGGDTWERVAYQNADTGFVDVIFDPDEPENVFAASYQRRRRAWDFSEGGPGSRVWRSQDGGDSWDELGGGLPAGDLGRIGLDVFRGDGQTVYCCIENLNPVGTPTTERPAPVGEGGAEGSRDRDANPDSDPDAKPGSDPAAKPGSDPAAKPEAPGDAEPDAEVLADPVARDAYLHGEDEEAQGRGRSTRPRLIGGEIYRSDDGGDSWTKTNEEQRIGGSPGYYYGQIRVDPNDRDTLYVLSVPVYRSTDGGKTWTPAGRRRSGAFATSLHVDHHALWIDPADSKHCLLGNDGGIAVTWDAGEHWDHLPTLPIIQAYTIAVDSSSPYNIYIGLQDNGTWGFPIHGPTTTGLRPDDAFKINGGDGFYTVVDPRDPDVIYTESQFGGMSRINRRTGERARIKPRTQKGQQRLRFNWMTPIVLSPHSPDTVYTGSQHLHRSRNRGHSWEAISPDLSTNDPDKKKGDVPHCTITTISESPKRAGMLWVGTDDGRVWLTKNDGDRWIEMTGRFPPAVERLWVSRVEASPHDRDTAFVSFTGYREDVRDPFVFRTDDAGETWLPIAHGLPMEPINVVRQHPRQSNVLFLGTEMGAFVSVNDGADWFRLGAGLPRVAVHDLIVHPNEPHVLLGTHGRGVWALDASAFENLEAAALASGFTALPPSGGVMLPSAYRRGYVGARGWTASNPFVNPTFRYVLSQDLDEDAEVEIEVRDVAGNTVWTGEGPTTAGYHEVRWQRPRGRGGFGNFGNFTGRNRSRSPRPGTFTVSIRAGERESTQVFEVIDRRPASTILGGTPASETGTVEVEEDGDSGRKVH